MIIFVICSEPQALNRSAMHPTLGRGLHNRCFGYVDILVFKCHDKHGCVSNGAVTSDGGGRNGCREQHRTTGVYSPEK